jgi:hypothetical protein
MSRPPWQAPADAVDGALLHLYPRALRERHGEVTRQAFRDRCGEVASGHTSAWRLLCLEMAPDFATSIAGAHMDHPHTQRMRASLAALALLFAAFFFQDSLSTRTLDAYFAAKLRWLHWNEERAFARDEARVRVLSERLAASPVEHDRALAAYVFALNSASRSNSTTYAIGAGEAMRFAPVKADADRSMHILATLHPKDAETTRLALAACRISVGCDRKPFARQLTQVEPQNAYGWSELLKVHSHAGSEAEVIEDLRRVGRSRYYDQGLAGSRESLYGIASRISGGDADALAALGRQLHRGAWMNSDEYTDTLRYKCALPWPNDPVTPAWLALHPQSRGDCRQAAVLSAQSRSEWESAWGWRWLDLDHSTPQTRAGLLAARQRMRQLPGGTFHGDDYYWDWTDDQWLDWARARVAAAN